MKCKLLLFDLDGTLLQSDKTISKRTMQTLEHCRKQGVLKFFEKVLGQEEKK